MHPPQLTVCGPHPGQGWRINSPGTTHYYRLLVRDPSSERNVVAPFVSYALNRAAPTISGTYSQGYPIKTRFLTASGVDYATDTITPEQQALFYSDTPYAPAIDHVLDNFCPFDLAAAIRQYRFYKDTQYAIQASIKKLQEKEMRYIEKGVEVLSDLENANALGRIFAHENDITTYALEQLTPAAYIEYVKIRGTFNGHVTHSALDVRTHHPRGTSAPFQSYWEKTQEARDQDARDQQDEYDSDTFRPARSSRSRRPIPVRRNVPLHVHARKRCHRCHKWGHIRATCPTRPYQYLGHRK